MFLKTNPTYFLNKKIKLTLVAFNSKSYIFLSTVLSHAARRGSIDGGGAEAGDEDQEDQGRVREAEGGHPDAQGSGTELAPGA